MPFVEAGGHRLEYEWLGPEPSAAPTIVMLHEGLGSVSLWRDFPQAVQEATGLGVLVYSRWGYGKSDPFHDYPKPVDYMTPEAQVGLRDVLRALGVTRPILLGHSDGASIAIIYAGSGVDPAPLGIILMAPHVFVEHICTVSIAKARVAYEAEGLRDKLARYHDDVDSAFYGWNTIWMRPQFIKDWNIEDFVDTIACPITVIQGEDDEYGTEAQYNSIRDHSGGRAEVVVLPDCGHSPHRDQREKTLAAITAHVDALKADAPKVGA
jgi:pimeloyl-ACP methyl ester carboxylesterase